MRITGGEKKGWVIRAPSGFQVRPPTGVIRKGIFDVLSDVNNKKILDLFAGSGSLSFEALSRGADSSTLVEKSPHVIKIIKENAEKLNVTDRIKILKGDAVKVVNTLCAQNLKYNLVFVDPPFSYPDNQLYKIFEKIVSLVEAKADVVLRVSIRKRLAMRFPFVITLTKRYGDSQVIFFKV